MDNLAISPEIIGAIIGGIFLLITTVIGGWFNVRAAQIRAETELRVRSSRQRARKTEQPTSAPEAAVQRPQKRPLPIWLLATGATIGAVLLIGGLALGGIIPIFQPPAAFTPTKTSLSIGEISDTATPATAAQARLGFPGNEVKKNADWTPISHTFDGIDMVLVPAGCFNMGSETGEEDEKGGERECFREPFWITVTEVTNMQYSAYGSSTGDNLPHVAVLWRKAVGFCDVWTEGGRLPTEAEWEYAARGPDNSSYPWGDSLQTEIRAVYSTKEDTKTGPSVVGSRPKGASWVGALDMSGNVWEWVSSLYQPYPYNQDDGREDTVVVGNRVVRGGSYEGYDVRASERYNRDQNYNYDSVGFRCVRDWSPSDLLSD